MRFMMIIKGSEDPEVGKVPNKEAFEEMGKFNEQIAKAGILLDMGGLQSTAKSARIKFSGGKRTVIDGPFTESKELVVGYWIVQVKSLEEDVEWAKRAPVARDPDVPVEIEVRQFFEIEDFPETERVVAAKNAGKKAGEVYM
ncbi:MAG: YciI family protein, partial [Acidobacteria bacterium]|nr:YciI family protein [Acidobacteriota bacterium]